MKEAVSGKGGSLFFMTCTLRAIDSKALNIQHNLGCLISFIYFYDMSEESKKKEAEFIYALQQGSKDALGLLYDKYSSLLFGVIYRITGDNELSENILQDSFVKIWRQFKEFDNNRKSLLNWLLDIARSTSREALRGQVPVQTEMKIGESVIHIKNIEKAGFELIYLKGLNYQEAAANLKISIEELKANVRIATNYYKKVKAL